MTRKLNAVLALKSSIAPRATEARTELYKLIQKGTLFEGQERTWEKLDDEGEDFSPESIKVREQAEDALVSYAEAVTPMYDIEATKDATNNYARADVVVEGKTLLSDVSVTTLLYLEKDLVNARTFIEKLPVLDGAYDWTLDPSTGLHKSDTVKTHRTKKISKPIVLYDAVVKDGQALPAQTQLITEDVLIGHWNTTKFSGSLTAPRKKALLARVEKLINAIKEARERANNTDEVKTEVGKAVFDYILGN